MNLALITLSTPTPDNVRTASALAFHIAKFRPESVVLSIYSFNLNEIQEPQIKEIEKELRCKIQILPISTFVQKLFKSWTAPLRAFIPKPMLAYLQLPQSVLTELQQEYDAYWVYGEDISHFAKYFSPKPVVVTTPDCEALYYHRVLGKSGIAASLYQTFRYGIMLNKYARMESGFPTGDNIKYHLVGEADRDFLENTCPGINAVFIRHPHYNYAEKSIAFNSEKIRILIAGRYDFYMKDKCDEMTTALMENVELAKSYKITFLGKYWENVVTKLKNAGYEVEYKHFVDDYRGELIQHDIQLTPIGVGTGTKGKVLDAFANGLMVIGTRGALENIDVKSGDSCYEYKKGNELIDILQYVLKNRKMAEQIAEKGRHQIFNSHGREIIAKQFFYLFNNK